MFGIRMIMVLYFFDRVYVFYYTNGDFAIIVIEFFGNLSKLKVTRYVGAL